MLLVGDIHINYRYHHDIITALQQKIAEFPDEKNIIFLGDYVYHFSYDREALLYLYQFWIELFKQGKNLYILAGNHDRIGKNFVYEEAQKAFEIIGEATDKKGKIDFITTPKITTVEGKDILFFPFSLDYEQTDLSLFDNAYPDIATEIKSIQEKKQKNLQISARANALLLKYIAENQNLTVIHHHYFDNVVFPGEKSKFSYKNIALSNQFLDIKNIQFISGHLHQSFAYKNYLCAGSVRNTSSLETNQIKGIYRYTQDKRDFYPLWINPNFSYELAGDEHVDRNKIEALIENMRNEVKSRLDQAIFGTIELHKDNNIPRKKSSIFINSGTVDYEKIDTYIDPQFRQNVKEVKLKKTKFQSLDIKNLASMYERKNMDAFSDWKSLLKDFLKNTYPDEYSQYETFLIKHKIL